MEHYLALILASLAIMGSPGPSTISATAMGAAYGVRRSLAYVAGLIAGTTTVLLLISIGVVGLLLAIPYGAIVLATASTAYILLLAYKIATAPPLDSSTSAVSAPAFGGGYLLAVANPKAYLAIAAVFAGTTLIAGHSLPDALAKIGVLTAMIVLIHVFWLLAGATLSRFLQNPRISRIANLTLAFALVVSAVVAVLN